MLLPVNPLTILTPNSAAARAVFSISRAALSRTPSGSPSPQTGGGRMAWCRSSMLSADRLAHEVIADGVALESVPVQRVPVIPAVGILFQRPMDLEVISPAGQLQAVVAELLGLAAHGVEIQIGPLPRKQSDRSSHNTLRTA